MSERPIIFSSPMVKALLDGRKTQTRRIIKPKAWNKAGDVVNINIASAANYTKGADGRMYFAFVHPRGGPLTAYVSPYAVGDRLWVREAWRVRSGKYDRMKPSDLPQNATVHYEANPRGEGEDLGKLRPSIHLPRHASRITLEVVQVRVQRLQEISHMDAKAEGVAQWVSDYFEPQTPPSELLVDFHCGTTINAFRRLWETLHGPDAWEANPWVVAVTFKRVMP